MKDSITLEYGRNQHVDATVDVNVQLLEKQLTQLVKDNLCEFELDNDWEAVDSQVGHATIELKDGYVENLDNNENINVVIDMVIRVALELVLKSKRDDHDETFTSNLEVYISLFDTDKYDLEVMMRMACPITGERFSPHLVSNLDAINVFELLHVSLDA